MTVWLDKKRNKWRYKFWIENKSYIGYCIHPDTGLHAKTKREAQTIDTLMHERAKTQPSRPPVSGYSLLEAATYYYDNHAKYLGERSGIKARIEELVKWFGANTDIRAITDEDVERYTNWARKQTLRRYIGGPKKNTVRKYKDIKRLRSVASVNDYLSALSQMLSVPPARRHLPVKPVIKMLKVPKRIPTPITPDVLNKIIEHGALHLKRVVILCTHTGMREREALTARTRQFNSEQGIIYLDETTKARKGRAVYINDVALEVIKSCIEDGDKLWATLQSNPKLAKKYASKWGIKDRNDIPLILYLPRGKDAVLMPIRRVDGAWKRARRMAGAEGKIRFHDTRATFCSYLASLGVDPIRIQRLAGHEDITTTMRYIKASDENLRDAVNLLANKKPLQLENDKVPHKSTSQDIDGREKST